MNRTKHFSRMGRAAPHLKPPRGMIAHLHDSDRHRQILVLPHTPLSRRKGAEKYITTPARQFALAQVVLPVCQWDKGSHHCTFSSNGLAPDDI